MRTEDRLRAAERAQDPVALLRARLRAGQVDRRLVALAAYCGDEVAREVAGWVAGGNGRVYYASDTGHSAGVEDALWLDRLGPDGLTRWAGRLPAYLDGHPRAHWLLVAMGLEVGRAVVAACSQCAETKRRGYPPTACGGCGHARVALDAAQAWLDCPCEGHVDDCDEASHPLGYEDSPAAEVARHLMSLVWDEFHEGDFRRLATEAGPDLPPDQVRAACLRAVQREMA